MLSLRPIRRHYTAAVSIHISKPTPAPARTQATTPETVPALIKLKKERDPEKLFHLFNSNARNRLIIENRFAFEDTVRRLAGARRFDYIERLLELQKVLPQGRREGFIIRIIMLYGKVGMIDHALDTFYKMHLFGCCRTVKSFNASLKVLCQTRNFDRIFSFFNEIPEKFRILQDEMSFNILIKAFCEMGRLDSAYLIMVEMEKSAGLHPDVFTYTTLISAFYKDGRHEIADGLWNRMVIKGCLPNLATFNVRIHYLVNKGRAWQAKSLMHKMVVLQIGPDELTYNMVIKGLCKVGSLEMAKKIFFGLKSRGCKRNRKIYQTMIHYLCKGDEVDLAFKLCRESMSRNWFPSVDSISRLLEALVMQSKYGYACEIMKLVRRRVPLYSKDELKAFEAAVSQDVIEP